MDFFQETEDFLCDIPVEQDQFTTLLSTSEEGEFFSLLQTQDSPSSSTDDFISETFSSPSTHTSDINSTNSSPLNTQSPNSMSSHVNLPPSLPTELFYPPNNNPTQVPLNLVNAYLQQNKQQLDQLLLVQAALQQPRIEKAQVVSAEASSTSSSSSSLASSENVKPCLKRKRENEEKLDLYKKRLEELNNKPAKALTEEEKEEKKKIRNRLSAKQSRDKKKEEQDFSSTERENLLSKNKALEQQVAEYQAEIIRLNNIISQLRSKISQNDTNLSAISSPLEECQLPASTEPPAKRFRTNMFIFLLCFTLVLLPFATFWNLNQPEAQHIISPKAKIIARSLKEISDSGILTRASTSIPSSEPTKLPNCTLQDKFSDKDKHFIEDAQCSFVEAEEHLNLHDFEKKIVSFPPKAKDHFVFTQVKDVQEKETKPIASTTSIHSRRALKRSLSKNTLPTSQTDESIPRRVINIKSYEEKKTSSLDVVPISQNPFSSPKEMETGVLYSFFAEKKEDNGDTVISLFAPFAYPLLDAAKEESTNTEDKKKIRLEIYMPAEQKPKVYKKQNDEKERIVRLLQIRSDNIEFGEAYFAFNPVIPVATADNQNEQNGSDISHPIVE